MAAASRVTRVHPALPEQAMLVKHDIRFKVLAAGLRMAGHAKLAGMVQNSWKIWKLYNTSTMDFHLFYCARNLAEMQVRMQRASTCRPCPITTAAKTNKARQIHLLTCMDPTRAQGVSAVHAAGEAVAGHLCASTC